MEESFKEQIGANAQQVIDQMSHSRTPLPNADEIKAHISEWKNLLLEEQQPSDQQLKDIYDNVYHHVAGFVSNCLYGFYHKETHQRVMLPLTHPVVRKLVVKNRPVNDPFKWAVQNYLCHYISNVDSVEQAVSDFKALGFSDEDIVMAAVSIENPFYSAYPNYRRRRANTEPAAEKEISNFGKYLLPLLPSKKGFLGIGKEEGLKKKIDERLLQRNSENQKFYWVAFQQDYFPDGITGMEKEYLVDTDYNNTKKLNLPILHLFIDKDPIANEKLVTSVLDENNALREVRFGAYLKLAKVLPATYDPLLRGLGEVHLMSFTSAPAKDHYYYDPTVFQQGSLVNTYAEYLYQQNPEEAFQRVSKFVRDAVFLTPTIFRYLNERYTQQAIPLLLDGLIKDTTYIPSNERDYHVAIIKLLEPYDLLPWLDKLVSFAVSHGDKKSRIALASVLSRYPNELLVYGEQLVGGKTVDQRVTGALLLCAIPSAQVTTILNKVVDKEVNDDTRDIILEALQEQRFASTWPFDQVTAMIVHAEGRKKLLKWTEKFINEEQLAPLYWKHSGQRLTEKEMRFLFYRMKRSKGLNSDAEARQLLNFIDTNRSGAFAKMVVAAFQESNADSKLKYYLTLGGILGDNDMMHSLHMLFKKSIADKRAKMAEYVIGALAMVGTDRALRIVESIFRKFANKKPAISRAAEEALTAAAAELNITMDELGDRIIPTFDFDGLFKNITIGEENYRAFISEDFRVHFFTDDNKLRKSLPSGASKELKTEIKEMEKEINDIAKTQPGRLEKVMLDARRWPVAKWSELFLTHPLLFVYALKLIWGEYDASGNLLRIFIVSQDAAPTDSEGEEIALEDTTFIGIVHPIQMTPAQLETWRDKAYNENITTLFPILDRKTFAITEEEDINRSFSKRFFDQEIPKGADFVNTFMVKQNWRKTSGDGGRSEFTKVFDDNLVAQASIDGPAAYYQGGNTKATLFEIYFRGKGWGDKVAIKDVPPLFYSEVMADIDSLIKA